MIPTGSTGPQSSSVGTGQWQQVLSAGAFAYKLVANEALIYMNMMYVYVCMRACSFNNTKPKGTAQHPQGAEPQLTHLASRGCTLPWPQQLQQKDAQPPKPAPSLQKSSEPCSAHALPRLVVDGTQAALGAAIKVTSVGVHRQLQ